MLRGKEAYVKTRIREVYIKMRSKTRPIHIACYLFIVLMLTGCSILPSVSGNTVVDSEYVTIGGSLTVHNTDARLTLLSNMDALSADGLYYASWTAGNSEPYENSDGDTVDLYDAQLYLLLGEFKNPDAAQQNMDTWLSAAQTNYDVTEEETITCNGQNYTMVTYNFQNEENTYAHGVSAFGVYNNFAVCAELTCRENYQEDLQQILTIFLDNCTYN